MKLVTGKNDNTVKLELVNDGDGDVSLTANGTKILWIDHTEGSVNLYIYESESKERDALEKMGFSFRNHKVAVHV